MEYYKTRYVPNNLTFIVVGDVDAAEVQEQLGKFFEDYPAQSLAPVYIPPEPPQLGRREVHEEFATELTHFALAWHVPEITHPDVAGARSALDHSRRWPQFATLSPVREEAGLVFGISAFSYTPGDPGLLGIDAVLEPKNRSAAESLILQIIGEIRQQRRDGRRTGQGEKISLVSVGFAHHHARPGFRSRIELVSHPQPKFGRDYLEAVQKVTLEDIKRVAIQYLSEENLTIVSLIRKGR